MSDLQWGPFHHGEQTSTSHDFLWPCWACVQHTQWQDLYQVVQEMIRRLTWCLPSHRCVCWQILRCYGTGLKCLNMLSYRSKFWFNGWSITINLDWGSMNHIKAESGWGKQFVQADGMHKQYSGSMWRYHEYFWSLQGLVPRVKLLVAFPLSIIINSSFTYTYILDVTSYWWEFVKS